MCYIFQLLSFLIRPMIPATSSGWLVIASFRYYSGVVIEVLFLFRPNTVEPRYNEVLGTMKMTLLYQVSHYIRVKNRNIKSWDQQNYLVIRGFCYIRPLYNEVPLYLVYLVYYRYIVQVLREKWSGIIVKKKKKKKMIILLAYSDSFCFSFLHFCIHVICIVHLYVLFTACMNHS